MKKIGVLGGTFNPVHIGHLAIAQIAAKTLELDKVIFVPSYLPPHKSDKNVIAARHRMAMVRLAIQDNPRFEISELEVKRKGKSYSVETMRYFKKLFPKETKFFFIVGGDSWSGLHSWKCIDELLDMVHFVVVNRSGTEKSKKKIKARFIAMPSLDISSSDVRRCLRVGKTIRYLVPENVRRYIVKYQLYKKAKSRI